MYTQTGRMPVLPVAFAPRIQLKKSIDVGEEDEDRTAEDEDERVSRWIKCAV